MTCHRKREIILYGKIIPSATREVNLGSVISFLIRSALMHVTWGIASGMHTTVNAAFGFRILICNLVQFDKQTNQAKNFKISGVIFNRILCMNQGQRSKSFDIGLDNDERSCDCCRHTRME